MHSELLSFLLPVSLFLGISLNLLSIFRRRSYVLRRRSLARVPFQAISLSITFPIIALIAPHYYHNFDLSLVHYLEHSVLKILVILTAINLGFLLGSKIQSRQGTKVLLEHVNASSYINEIDTHLDQFYVTIEQDILNRGLDRLSTRVTHFLEKINQLSFAMDWWTFVEHIPRYVEKVFYPIERCVNELWTGLVKKSERIPHVLSHIQTGFLSNNLLLVLGFLLFFIILLFITSGG
jgi:hypothetical protein